MKILYHHRVASRDGQFVHIDAIIRVLRSKGHEVIIVSPGVSESSNFGDSGGWVTTLRRLLPAFCSELLEFFYCFYDFFKLCSAIRKHQPDAIYERYNLFLPSGIWAKQLFGLPLVLEVNSPLFNERSDYGGLSLAMLARWSEIYTWRNADHIVPVTHVLATYLHDAGIQPQQITVIPNGIHQSQLEHDFSPAVLSNQRKPVFKEATVIGFVGFCREWHRLDAVIETIANLNNPKLHLIIVGDGPVLDSLKKQAEAYKLTQQIHFPGLVSRKELPVWLAQIDIALQPAVTPWCSPLKMMEYLASGKAIIAPNSENIRELLAHGHNALLFQDGNMDGMLDAITFLTQHPALSKQLGLAARQTITDLSLTWEHNGETITDIIDALLTVSEQTAPTTQPR